jgi:hypothetical protein
LIARIALQIGEKIATVTPLWLEADDGKARVIVLNSPKLAICQRQWKIDVPLLFLIQIKEICMRLKSPRA